METLENIWDAITDFFSALARFIEGRITALFGSSNARFLKKIQPRVDAINKLDPLPNDFQEAIENLKVAILTRKIEEWKDVQPIQIAAYLSELKRLLVSLEK